MSCLIHDNIVGKIREQLSQNRFLLCNGQLFEVRCAMNLIKVTVEDCLDALSLTMCCDNPPKKKIDLYHA